MISTNAQCTATLEDVLTQVEKLIRQVGSDPNVLNSQRWLKETLRALQKNAKPSASEVKNLVKACNTIRGLPLRMPELHNQLYDIEDYVERL